MSAAARTTRSANGSREVVIAGHTTVPDWVVDFASFDRWACSTDFPKDGWLSFLDNRVWVDFEMEEYVHNQLKGQFALVLMTLIQSADLGRFFSDRFRIRNASAGLSHEPDGMFVSWSMFESGRARLISGTRKKPLQLEGMADMVLEIVSPNSAATDLEVLPDLYFQAGIREYWIVDARGERATFKILRANRKGMRETAAERGWVASPVFGKSFRLTQTIDRLQQPAFALSVK